MMKGNNYLLAFLLYTLSLQAMAQGETRFGIKAGFTSSSLSGPDQNQLSNNGNPSNLQGLHFGIFVNSKISKNFWIKSELLTIPKGANLQVKNPSGLSYTSKLKSQYIDIYPISPTLHWKGLQLLAGPYVSLLLTSSLQDSTGAANANVFGYASSLSSYRQKLDAGYVLGAEYELPSIGISLGVRYTKGFMPLFENAGAITANPTAPPLLAQKIYNQSLSISVGYSFGGHAAGKSKGK